MQEAIELKVTSDHAGKRLDLFIALEYGKISRTEVRKQLDIGAVSVNGAVEYRPNYKVSQDDVVHISLQESAKKSQVVPWPHPIKVVYNQGGLVGVDKPIGMSVHPISNDDTQTLLNAMYFQLQISPDGYGVNLINRIDKATSGLVLAATTPRAAWHYSKQFAESTVDKTYIVLVYGNWLSKFGYDNIKNNAILKYDHVAKKQTVNTLNNDGDFAETSFQLINFDAKSKYGLLWARPTTGRTHQIRAQLAHMGFPILGDDKYGGQKFNRLMLHSLKVTLDDFNDNSFSIETEVPKEFRKYSDEKI